MKKYIILTSLIVLTACGGGSGGSPTGDPARPRNTTSPIVSDKTYNSNKNVTSMVSRLLISNDSAKRTLARTSTVQYEGADYKEYDLSDVKFAVADESFETDGMKLIIEPETKEIIALDMDFGAEPGYPTIYKYVRDENGKITSLEPVSEEEATDAEMHPEKYLVRTSSNDNEFIGFVNFSDDEDDENNNENNNQNNNENQNTPGDEELDGANWVQTKVKYNSLGQLSEKHKLRYSDFGNIEIAALPGWRAMFVGGYDIKQIEPQNIDTEKTFNGHATASVVAIKKGTGTAIALDDKNASLTFKDGESKLSAEFDKWYNVAYSEEYDENGNAINKTATFTNFKNDGDDKFRMLSDTKDDNGNYISDTAANGLVMTAVTNTEQHGSNIETFDSIRSDIRYYGDNGNPSESVGLIQVRDCDGKQCGNNHDEVRMNLGFGGMIDIKPVRPQK